MNVRTSIQGVGHVRDAKGGWVLVLFDAEGQAHPLLRIRPDGHGERMPDLPKSLGLQLNGKGQIKLAKV